MATTENTFGSHFFHGKFYSCLPPRYWTSNEPVTWIRETIGIGDYCDTGGCPADDKARARARWCSGAKLTTFLTVVALVASVATAGAHQANPMSSTVDVDALVGRHVALHALPAAVALAAAVRVLAVSVAKNRTGSWKTKQQESAVGTEPPAQRPQGNGPPLEARKHSEPPSGQYGEDQRWAN